MIKISSSLNFQLIIAFFLLKETVKHLDLFDEIIIELLNKKWNTYIKYTYNFV